MLRRDLLLSALALPLLTLAPRKAAAGPQEDLNALSEYRGLNEPFTFDLEILASGEAQRAKVIFQSFDAVLVDFNAPRSHVGRRILFSGPQMWMALPGSARPLRVTPADRLMGEASIGDILNIDPAAYAAEEGEPAEIDGRSLRRVTARGARSGLLYPRVDFFVDEAVRPARSLHYAQSGQVLKTVSYVAFGPEAGRERTQEILISEAASQGAPTRLRFSNYRAEVFPAALFNPAALKTPLTY